MQTSILWTGREYYSLENCLINTTGENFEINSVIIDLYEGRIYRVEYYIKTNHNWETQLCEVKTQLDDKREILSFCSEGKGAWTMNGKPSPEFEGCIDVDIPLTPFTNTLPINRLKLLQQEQREIKVVYIDILEHQIKSVRQKYVRLSETEYKYENVPNDFEAVIKVDESGFVIDYPELFVRTAIRKSNYS